MGSPRDAPAERTVPKEGKQAETVRPGLLAIASLLCESALVVGHRYPLRYGLYTAPDSKTRWRVPGRGVEGDSPGGMFSAFSGSVTSDSVSVEEALIRLCRAFDGAKIDALRVLRGPLSEASTRAAGTELLENWRSMYRPRPRECGRGLHRCVCSVEHLAYSQENF